MDSIVKNIGRHFVALFAPRLPLLVLSTFDGLPPRHPVQSSIVKLVDSWRQARSFSPEIVADIKRKLMEPPPSLQPPPPPRAHHRPANVPIMHAAPPPHHHLPHQFGMVVPPPSKRVRHHAPSPLPAVLPIPVGVADPQPVPLAPVNEPLRADFSNEALRKPAAAAVAALYSAIPLQCEYCALRIASKADMAKHLDWHFKENRESKLREKSSRSQLWFMSLDEWVSCSGEDEREAPPSFFDQELAAQDAASSSKKVAEKVCLPGTCSSYWAHLIRIVDGQREGGRCARKLCEMWRTF